MTMNPLPPQAYTKETLVKAYQWLQHQSDSIKEMASNPDILVSLYLKAKLQGDGALERPSIQNFKNELRNLAGMMGEFEVLEPGLAIPTSSAPVAPPSAPSYQHSHASYAPPAPQPTHPTPHSVPANPQAAALPSANGATAFKGKALPELDTRSWLMIQEVKNQLNLSSEQEALRVLISVGNSKIKALLEK